MARGSDKPKHPSGICRDSTRALSNDVCQAVRTFALSQARTRFFMDKVRGMGGERARSACDWATLIG